MHLKILLVSVLFVTFNSFSADKGFYYEYQNQSPVENGIIYYGASQNTKDSIFLKLYGHQGLEGFKGYKVQVDAKNNIMLIGKKTYILGKVNKEECGDAETYEEDRVELCLIEFNDSSLIEVRTDHGLEGWTDANGFPQMPHFVKHYIFRLEVEGKKVSETRCEDHFLSCRF